MQRLHSGWCVTALFCVESVGFWRHGSGLVVFVGVWKAALPWFDLGTERGDSVHIYSRSQAEFSRTHPLVGELKSTR